VPSSSVEPLAPEQQVDDVILAKSLYNAGVVAHHAAIETAVVRAADVTINRTCASGDPSR
jgi:hypothetical protein